MAIVLRKIKGAPLSIDELDGNFRDLDERINQLNAAMAASVNIASIERNGNALWFISKTGDVIADVQLPESPETTQKLPVYDRKTLKPEGEIGQLVVFINKAGMASIIFYDGTKWCHVSNNEPIVRE